MVAERLGLSATAVKATAELLDEGATVPFISRYRKERTGSLDEVAVRDIETTLKSVAELLARKEFVRQWLIDHGFMGREGQQVPEMTPEFIQSVSERYIELFEHVTGQKFVKADENDLTYRIYRNVSSCLLTLKK